MAPDGRVMFVAPAWIEAHCVVPDGFLRGAPFRHYDWQLAYVGAMYTVRSSAVWAPANPVKAPAFVYRRGLLVGPQKLGKDPIIAAQICLEGAGPALFAGWAGKDEGYACADWGCRCGWEYSYDVGEPKGMRWPTPLIQITAVSEDQTDNTYDALRPMIELGPLADLVPKTGEEFIRLPGGGRIETVTSSAPSRLGQRTTHVAQGEAGLYTPQNGMAKVARTQYRNLAGMGGRASMNSNAWDPTQRSIAQLEFESSSDDIYRYFVKPPANLSFGDKRERRKILRAVYPPEVLRQAGGHVDLDSIEAEAADMVEKEPAEAARFFGNKLVEGAGKAIDFEAWKSRRVQRPHEVPAGALITLGFDGSRRRDHTAIVATEVASGYQWPLRIWKARDYREGIPRDVVDAVIEQAFETWDVWRLYADPPYWEETVAGWAGRFGKERVAEWWTNRNRPMAYALRAWRDAIVTGELSHCPERYEWCALFTLHVGNAVKRVTGYRDDGGELWTVEKPSDDEKIDSVVAATLSWEARNDAIAAGALNVEEFESVYETRGLTVVGAD